MSKKIIATLSDARGVSIIESLVALALLSIISVTLATIYSTTVVQAKRIVNNGLCDQHNQKIYTKLLGQKVKDAEPNNFIKPTYSTKVYPTNAVTNYMELSSADQTIAKLAKRFEYFEVLDKRLYETVNSPPPVVDLAFMQHNGLISYMPLLANNYMGYLGDLYIDGHNQAAGFKDLPVELQAPMAVTFSQKNTVASKIKVELYNRESQSTVADAKFWPLPAAQYKEPGTTVARYFPFSKNKIVMAQFPDWMKDELGFKVTLQSKVTHGGGDVETCETTRFLSYAPDIQNVISYGDFAAVKYTGLTSTFEIAKLRDKTEYASNKAEAITSDVDPLAPIFTNYNAAFPAEGRNRNVCSQMGQNLKFYVKFIVKNMNLDSGVIPLCIDNSTQWLASELNGGSGWCTDKYVTPIPGGGNSGMKLKYDWKPGSTGWVPCEYLTFCGEPPQKVEVVPSGNDLEYRYHYDVTLDAGENRLWGCELKYMAAAVDVAGNLSYPPTKKIDLSSFTPAEKTALVSKLNPEGIREINPKIYFKPPPCYTCSCKKCKRGSGGFLGGIFALFLLIVLVIVTGGAALVALPGLITAGAGLLSVMCVSGGLGCRHGGDSGAAAMTAPGSGYASCKDVDNGCKCGHTCNRKIPKGPRWSDTLQSGINPATYNTNLVANSCELKTLPPTLLGPVATTVSPTFGYKTDMAGPVDPLQYQLVQNSTNMYYVRYDVDEEGVAQTRTVAPGEEVIWQSFDRTTGVFCVSRYRCSAGSWIHGTQPFEYDPTPYNDVEDVVSGNANAEGCFKVKTGYKIDWLHNGGGTKPLKGAAECLEPDFPPGVFNQTGDVLRGTTNYNYFPASPPQGYGCGPDTGDESVLPNPFTPNQRIVGMKVEDKCSEAVPYDTFAGPQNFKIAVPDAIYDDTYDMDGSLVSHVFRCWKQCVPPANMPEYSQPGHEQLYYENYSPGTDNALPFCNLKRSDFDEIH